MYDEEYIEKTLKAGEIVNRVLRDLPRMVKPGVKVFDLCEKIENLIIEGGGKPAFPCNISINNIAAHYTAFPEDQSIIPDDAVVKVDIGAHFDGYIVDAATTISFNSKYDDMVEASRIALKNALKVIKPGVRVSTVSKEIERTISGFGYKPISNLTGHMLKRYILHGGKNIPNVYGEYPWIMEEGEIYAIEPFATDGIGSVTEMQQAYIYSLAKVHSGRTRLEKELLRYIYDNFKTLPFCERWLKNFNVKQENIREIIYRLVENGALNIYPVLREVKNGIVTQFETTVIVSKEGPIITTEM
ncbi:MAG: type II methionyl aminopeptidase [Candidatus Verstraetearchaeota archaeon]|jgi:methionyl aminopeptidase|nr:type II methionyl aminopeptidase [Candidatus Verstraetearchaeota archaeon]